MKYYNWYIYVFRHEWRELIRKLSLKTFAPRETTDCILYKNYEVIIFIFDKGHDFG